VESCGVGVVGWGTVGEGVIELLEDEAGLLSQRSDLAIDLRAIVTRTPSRARARAPRCETIGDDLDLICGDPAIAVVCHLVGGTDEAFAIAMRLIEAGKHVVTANKALLAEHADELLSAAASHGVKLAYEAAVAGGIPIIAALRDGLVANHITGIRAILNGTCNYVLTEMEERGTSFAEALAQAQELGYAEADPTLDIDGTDSAHKLAILARLAFGRRVDLGRVSVEGIEAITVDDIESAQRLGCRIKLLAVAVPRDDGRCELHVAPTLVPTEHPLGGVGSNFNAVLIDAHAAGETLLVGQGAGSLPTASAVVADLVDIATGSYQGELGPGGELAICPENDEVTGSYARFTVADEPGILAKITERLAAQGISILAVHQNAPIHDRPAVIEVVTHPARGGDFFEALRGIESPELVYEPPSTLRMMS